MYAKVFTSLWEGSLRGKTDEILVFINLLTHCRPPDGYVDRHFKVIADETGLSIDRVRAAIVVLEAPDIESRTPDLGGRRIERIDDHRDWGWRVVNYEHYRSLNSEMMSQEKNRVRQQLYRDRLSGLEATPPLPPSEDKQKQKQKQGLTLANSRNERNVTKEELQYEIPESLNNDRFLVVWSQWIEDRKARKNPVTVYAAKIQLRKLSKWGTEKAIASIEASIENSWRGIFEPKTNQTKGVKIAP